MSVSVMSARRVTLACFWCVLTAMYSTPHQGVAHAFILRNLFDRTRGTNTTTTTTTTSIPHAVSHQSDWCGEGTQRSFVRSFLCSIGAGAGAGTPAVAPQPDDAQETPATTPPTAESPQPVILDDLPETEDLVTPTPSAPAPAPEPEKEEEPALCTSVVCLNKDVLNALPKECGIELNSNFKGALVPPPPDADPSLTPTAYYHQLKAPSAAACCQMCWFEPLCNTFSFCPTDADKDGGCYRGCDGEVYSRGECFLKMQPWSLLDLLHSTGEAPLAYDRGGPWVPWVSGVLVGKPRDGMSLTSGSAPYGRGSFGQRLAEPKLTSWAMEMDAAISSLSLEKYGLLEPECD